MAAWPSFSSRLLASPAKTIGGKDSRVLSTESSSARFGGVYGGDGFSAIGEARKMRMEIEIELRGEWFGILIVEKGFGNRSGGSQKAIGGGEKKEKRGDSVQKKKNKKKKKKIVRATMECESAELCLSIDDSSKSGLTKDDAMKKIKAEGIVVSKVIKLLKLKTDYKAFESKRKLCDSYDMFLAHKCVTFGETILQEEEEELKKSGGETKFSALDMDVDIDYYTILGLPTGEDGPCQTVIVAFVKDKNFTDVPNDNLEASIVNVSYRRKSSTKSTLDSNTTRSFPGHCLSSTLLSLFSNKSITHKFLGVSKNPGIFCGKRLISEDHLSFLYLKCHVMTIDHHILLRLTILEWNRRLNSQCLVDHRLSQTHLIQSRYGNPAFFFNNGPDLISQLPMQTLSS
ncbi:hypothetical protein G4B88_030706 [Cannabis sativa]|uniref:Uncharacterized protein n=1 Tax=Cannabis sativa TaxID=3483 RepID=A0A7J6H8V7_CANSA|nr:hypothetical protein G4B88_030706 [Cannabis sativa]